MEYTVNKLAKISGVTPRTLRYYNEIGLLIPERVNESGYRLYGENEVDRLQQILFYKELGMGLKEIEQIISSNEFNREKTLESHLAALLQEKQRMESLINNVKHTIQCIKGEYKMEDIEKFEGLKKSLIEENEKSYGKEIRGKYGDSNVDKANKKLENMKISEHNTAKDLEKLYLETLKTAIEIGDPTSSLAEKACELHKQWLNCYWPEGMYTKEAHKNLGEMYVVDERFRVYYDKIAPNMAEFFSKAINNYCSK